MEEEQSLVSGPSSTEFELTPPPAEEELVKETYIPRPPVIDVGEEEIDIMLRYDNTFMALVHAGWELSGSSENGSLVDWCMCYGLQGRPYFDLLRNQLNFAMLRCALFIIAAMAAYINPPNLGNSKTNDFFMVMVGFSAVASLCGIIGYTMFSVMINRPYALIDSMVARVRNNAVYVFGTVFDACGMLSLLVALLLARTGDAGAIAQPMAVMLFILILVTWTWAIIYTDEVQVKKVKFFFTKYVDPHSGMLNAATMAKIYKPADLAAFLQAIDQSQHLEKFQGFDLEAVLLMEKADLIDLFQVNQLAPRNGSNDKSTTPEQRSEQRTARLLLLTEIRAIYEEIQRVRKLTYRG